MAQTIHGNKGEIMKCLACGRVMLNKGTHFVCPNVLCDYSEEIENREVRVPELLSEHVRPIMAWEIKR
jgi:predicted RNA-binding Zn-ribbon protein involved in translation (DUF1610 family)